jgi:hypothetical protein
MRGDDNALGLRQVAFDSNFQLVPGIPNALEVFVPFQRVSDSAPYRVRIRFSAPDASVLDVTDLPPGLLNTGLPFSGRELILRVAGNETFPAAG